MGIIHPKKKEGKCRIRHLEKREKEEETKHQKKKEEGGHKIR